MGKSTVKISLAGFFSQHMFYHASVILSHILIMSLIYIVYFDLNKKKLKLKYFIDENSWNFQVSYHKIGY
jgi:hypothetical protein